ncbi:MAG: FAD-dependent oxidoreductase, partial [Spirochaetota bacterium]
MDIIVPEKKVPVAYECDVLVVGGGPAGIAAAVSAARHGAKTLLVERWPSVGGQATNALVNIWHTSDRKKQVIFGLVQEVIERAGPVMHRLPHYPERSETHEFEPSGMRVVFHQLLEDAGVRTICHLAAVESIIENNIIRGVLVDAKTGRKAIRAKIVIDATGDGDIAANADVPFAIGRDEDGRVQGMTMMFRLCGIDPAKAIAHPREADRVFAR